MAWVSRVLLLLLLLVVVVVEVRVEGFHCPKSDQPPSGLRGWLLDDDTMLGEMKSHWMKQQLFAIPLYDDMWDWGSHAGLSRKSTIFNSSSMTKSDDDDDDKDDDGARCDFPLASNKESSAEIWVRIPSVVNGDNNGAELMSDKILRQIRRRNDRRRERRRRRKNEGQNNTNTWTSQPTNRSPNLGILLTLGSNPSDTEGSFTPLGPLWLDAQGSRGIRSSLRSSEGLREETVKTWPRSEEVREGRMRGKERTTDRRRGGGKKRAEKRMKRIVDKKGTLQTKLILPIFQQ